MSAESIQQFWQWLLSLSKVQLILLGGGVALLVAVSKILRFLFLLGVVVIFLTVLLPGASKWYENSPLAPVLNFLFRQGVEAAKEATKDPEPAPQPENPASTTKEGQ